MDIRDEINVVIKQIKKDPKFGERFKVDPTDAVISLLGSDIAEGAIEHVVAGVKAKMAEKANGGFFDKLKKVIK